MEKSDIKCRIMEEELQSFWPQWHVVKRLGGGSFGDVFQIYKEEFGVRVDSALKVIQSSEADDELLITDDPGFSQKSRGQLPQMLENEIRIMEILRSAPNIVTIEDFYYRDDIGTKTLYVRMELLTSFQDVLRNVKKSGAAPLPGVPASVQVLTVDNILKVGRDICTALMYCERRGVIHRDIKPANLFVDSFGNYKVGDFGASKRTQTLSVVNTMTGTISYMAPEIFSGRPYNRTVDIYALGLVLYQLLNSGRMPFLPTNGRYTAADIDSANYKRIHGTPIPPLTGARIGDRVINASLDAVVRRACMPDPADRYQSAADFYNALNQYSIAPDRVTPLPGNADAYPAQTVRNMPAGNTYRNPAAAGGAPGTVPGNARPETGFGNTYRNTAAGNSASGSAAGNSFAGTGPANTFRSAPAAGNSFPGTGSANTFRSAPAAGNSFAGAGSANTFRSAPAAGNSFAGTGSANTFRSAPAAGSAEKSAPDRAGRKTGAKDHAAKLIIGGTLLFMLIVSVIVGIWCVGKVDIPDPVLKKAIQDQLSLEDQEITRLNTLYLTQLEYDCGVNGDKISDLTGLSAFKNLVVLSLDGNNITDLTPLTGLDQMVSLSLEGNGLQDISAISGMTKMSYLNLEQNNISDISALSGMQDIEYLYLGENQITDITPLSGLTELDSISLMNNQISNINPLSGMTKLTALELGGNQINDIWILTKFPDIEALGLSYNQISDITPLSGMTKLGTLYLAGNPVLDTMSREDILEFLSSSKNLRTYDF